VLTPAVLARIFCPWVHGGVRAAAGCGGRAVKLLDTRRPYPNFQPWRRVYMHVRTLCEFMRVCTHAFSGWRIKGPRGGDEGATRDQ